METNFSTTDEHVIRDSIFRIGVVIAVEGQSVKVKVDKGKNTSSVLYKGDIIQNISVGGYLKIKKGFSEMVAKIEGESITEEKSFFKSGYKNNQQKICRVLSVKILGFIDKGEFKRGIKELPLIDNQCFLLGKEEFDQIHKFTEDDDEPIPVGKLEYDDGQVIELGMNKLFASHIGIFGNTGSGKSYTLAKIYRELFQKGFQMTKFKENTKFFFIDFNGEYSGDKTIIEGKQVYNLTTSKRLDEITDEEKIGISEAELLDVEMISILADATEKTQKPFISRSLNYYRRVVSVEDPLEYFRNALRQSISNVLKMAHKEKAFMLIDYFTNILKGDESTDLISNTIEWNNTNLHFMPRGGPSRALTDDEIVNSDLHKAAGDYVFPEDILLKIIHFMYLQLVYDIYTDKAQNDHIAPAVNKLRSKKDDIRKVLKTDGSSNIFPDGKNIVILNLHDVNLDIKKTLPLLFCKKLYSEQKKVYFRHRNKSLHIVIDEAHNILSRESVREAESWKDYRLETFEEIIKEGRKFGTFLTIASQRPSDISSTIISQLHNYFLHRLINNNDLLAVEKTIAYLDKVSADSIPNLATGTCIIAGLMAQIPVVVKIDEISDKDNQPISQTINLLKEWK